MQMGTFPATITKYLIGCSVNKYLTLDKWGENTNFLDGITAD
jgi:hypothetical protein